MKPIHISDRLFLSLKKVGTFRRFFPWKNTKDPKKHKEKAFVNLGALCVLYTVVDDQITALRASPFRMG